jgi:hypothetical protein
MVVQKAVRKVLMKAEMLVVTKVVQKAEMLVEMKDLMMVD